jgi:CHAD domain-containing protein
VKAREIEGLDPQGRLGPNAARIVRTRLDELRGFAVEALEPNAGTVQHNMRIAAKRLRYALEIVGPCIGEEAKLARDATKQLQSVLGDLHDCNLMLPKVEQIDSAAALLRDRRERLFREFVQFWRNETDKGTWTTLERVL